MVKGSYLAMQREGLGALVGIRTACRWVGQIPLGTTKDGDHPQFLGCDTWDGF